MINSGHENRIATKRLLLRPFDKSDREAVLDLYSDARTMLYWSQEPIASLEDADLLIEREMEWSSADNCLNWGIALADSNLLAVEEFKLILQVFPHRTENIKNLHRCFSNGDSVFHLAWDNITIPWM